MFLERARAVLGGAGRRVSTPERLELDMLLCCLDTLAAMTLAPAVTDVVLPPQSRVKVRTVPRCPELNVRQSHHGCMK